MIAVSMPAARNRASRFARPLDQRAETPLDHVFVARPDIEPGPQRGSFGAFGECRQHVAEMSRIEKLHVGRPGARRVVAVDRPHPPHGSAGRTHGRRKPVDIGHDRLAIRRVGEHARLYPDVLHVDDEQGGFRRIETLDGVHLATPTLHHSCNHLRRQLNRVRLAHDLFLTTIERLGHDGKLVPA
jgi:hypothetical protein